MHLFSIDTCMEIKLALRVDTYSQYFVCVRRRQRAVVEANALKMTVWINLKTANLWFLWDVGQLTVTGRTLRERLRS